MTTWQLWRALKSPPYAHPVFRRMVQAAYYDDLHWPTTLQSILLQGQIWVWSLIFVLDTRALILMVLGGTLYGSMWAVSISGAIAGEREYGMYDLLCLSPSGTVGANWALCTGCLHRRDAFGQVNSQEAWSIRIILFIPLIISANLVLGRIFTVTGWAAFVWLGAFLLLFYVDHIQSIILGSLFGVLAPHHASNRTDTRLWALAGFMMVQSLTYCLLLLTSLIVLPTLYQQLGLSGWAADLSIPLLSIGVFYLVREVVTRRLWARLTQRLNAAPMELDVFSRGVAS